MGRKITFDTEKAIDLLTKGVKQKDIAIQLGIKESTLKMYLKRNHSDKLEKIRENRKKKLNKSDDFKLEQSNRLTVKDLKEISENNRIGINANESMSAYSFILANIQSYKLKGNKYVFDESRGKITYAVPKSY